MMASEQPGSGAAQRRRQRRLRSWLRHERMTVAKELAESTHHSSRGQTIAKAWVWGREMNNTATIRDPPPLPPLPPPTPKPELFSLHEEEPGGSRPDRFFEVKPQEAVQRHTVEQLADDAPRVPTLDVPVSLMVGQLVEVFSHIDTVVPEQVIDVPKITSHDIILQSAVLPVPQMVEQRSDVPVPSPRDCVITATLTEVVLARRLDTAGRQWWLLHRDGAYSANCTEDQRFHGAVLGRCRHARWCATTGLWFRQCRKLWLPQVQCSDKVGRPCDYAATQSRSWRCRRFSSSPESADIPVATETDALSVRVTVMNGFFGHFSHFFALLPGCPGVERQFSSPR